MNGKWNDEYLTYDQTVELFNKTLKGGKSVFFGIQAYFDEMLKKFNSFLVAQPQQQSQSPPQKLRPATIVEKPTANNRNSTGSFIGDRASNPILTLRQTANYLIQFSKFLKDTTSEYESRMQEVINKATGALQVLKEAKSRREYAYDMYAKSGEELKVSYDNKYPNLPEMQSNFLEFQKNAVDAHTHMNEVTAQTAMKMESAISEFEDIEKWRSDKFKEIIDNFSTWLRTFSHDLSQSSQMLEFLFGQIPTDESIEKSMDTSELLVPAADADYQIAQVDLLFSKFIPTSEIFKEEQQQGKELYQVTAECDAHGQFLRAVPGEIVVALEVNEENIKARDINECEGLIPLSSVTKYSG
ncbi:hypothetical protein M9Y10_019110 [Tritrichomonas musculus]|uniref:BAR domain-containing protein n=1 Tax=Tritrichomonas musculus TaxID=1915356 RepID=A0ABR2HJJ3_9EUKA